jgi:hypothetical protein
MHRTTRTLAWFCLLPFFAQAEPEQAKADAPKFLSGAQVKTFVSDRLTAGKTAVFRSRDGKFYGMDSDSVVSLEKDNTAVVGECGYAYQGYRGTYAVAADGVISISLKGYRGNWPDMKIAKEGDLIRLFSADGNGNFVFGGRAGGVETEDMKPFWPFRLVETDSTPEVTPIWSGGDIKVFTSPTLPEDFEWKGDLIEFRVDFTTLKDGKASVQKHWPTFGEKDWRLPAAKAAIHAMEGWVFYPYRSDGEPTEVGQGWNFEITRIGDQVRWVVKDDVITVFDNMPRERDE